MEKSKKDEKEKTKSKKEEDKEKSQKDGKEKSKKDAKEQIFVKMSPSFGTIPIPVRILP
ncbi:hypothetical protein AAVH_19517 [Aphelenchoides avenae]|nr:hypothetical protein AAVH_19517 [Aphelenchus avenae]